MSGEAIFAAIGAGVVALAVFVGRVFRRTVNKPMPGSHDASTGAFWRGGVDRDGPGDESGGGGH